MEILFSILGYLLAVGAYYLGKSRGHETVVTEHVLVQDTDYQAYRVELLDCFERVVQSHVFYALSEPRIKVNRDTFYIDNHLYHLGDTAKFSVSSIRITKLKGK